MHNIKGYQWLIQWIRFCCCVVSHRRWSVEFMFAHLHAALTLIAGSPLKINLRPVLPDAVPILASFLRKNQRALKLCTLAALDILLRNYR